MSGKQYRRPYVNIFVFYIDKLTFEMIHEKKQLYMCGFSDVTE